MADISKETSERVAKAWPALIVALESGALVSTVLRDHGISRGVVYRWKRDRPVQHKEWEDAREASADALYDEAMDAARSPGTLLSDGTLARRDPQHTRNLIDTLKWAARIRNPRLYSDKTTLDVNVKHVDLTRIIENANARLQARSAGRVIEHEMPAALPDNRGEPRDATRTSDDAAHLALALAHKALGDLL